MKTVKIIGNRRLGFSWWGDKLKGEIVDVFDTPHFTKDGKKFYEIISSAKAGKRMFIPIDYCVPAQRYFLDEKLFEIE